MVTPRVCPSSYQKSSVYNYNTVSLSLPNLLYSYISICHAAKMYTELLILTNYEVCPENTIPAANKHKNILFKKPFLHEEHF